MGAELGWLNGQIKQSVFARNGSLVSHSLTAGGDDDGNDEKGVSLRTDVWKLTLLVVIEFLGACTLLTSAHHLYMYMLKLEDTVITDETKFRVVVLFVCDFCTVIIALIGLSTLLGAWIPLCSASV